MFEQFVPTAVLYILHPGQQRALLIVQLDSYQVRTYVLYTRPSTITSHTMVVYHAYDIVFFQEYMLYVVCGMWYGYIAVPRYMFRVSR